MNDVIRQGDDDLVIKWQDDVADHDYEAALNFLTLRLDPARAKIAVRRLKRAKVTCRRANDILRATGHAALPMTDPGVERNRKKVWAGKKLSPILVLSFSYGGDIADGYHRCSLAYNLDPFGEVPLRLAHVPELHGSRIRPA